ncbi:MAG TPA: amino acid adenylation domain-containing protein [Thermoanaerobaculia bacterium]|nr:amino acid adenylation domain-containing protein [Thermoanaerobaculia bacterium]
MSTMRSSSEFERPISPAAEPMRAEDFWRTHLAGVGEPPAFSLPRPEAPGEGRDACESVSSPAVSRALAIFAAESAISIPTLAQGAWALLLSRHADAGDVVFWATDGASSGIGERSRRGPRGPVLRRVRVPEAETVGRWLAGIQKDRDRLRLAPPARLDDLQRWAGWQRDAVVESRLEHREFASTPEASSASERPPIVLRIDVNPRVAARLSWDAARYARPAMERLLGRFAALLERLVSAPEAAVGDVDVLSPEERRTAVVEWNRTSRPYPENDPAHRLIERAVDRTPDAEAVVGEGAVLSFSELDARANRIAHRLRAEGVSADVPVALLMERSPWLVAAVLGVLKSGGAYLPLDPRSPDARLEFILRDARVPVVLADPALVSRVAGTGARVIPVEADGRAFADQPDRRPDPAGRPDDLAYVIYTSGSTGQPKGVLIPHRGLVNYLAWSAETYAVADGEGAPVHSPLVFDLTVTSLLTPLVAGRRVETIPEREGLDGLAEALRRRRGWSLVKITPAHLEILASQLSPAEARGAARVFVVGGEALRGEGLERWVRNAPESRFVNEYGPTETVVGCCVHEVTAATWKPGPVPIGRPIANTRLYVLDSGRRPVPPGVPGELYIGGDGLARGYLGRPDLTAKSFVPNPLPEEPGERLYRTGDRVRHRDDGILEYLGRADDQVKVRGYRIELGEVESALRRHPGVRQASVVVASAPSGDPRLVAYFSSNGGEYAPRREELRTFLAGSLPEYMIPSAFVELDELPLTPNGKVDRRALPPPPDDDAAAAAGRAPSTETERRIAAIWEEGIGRAGIGVDDDFFRLGGHSVIAARIFARIESVLGIRLPLAVLLQAPTIARLAEVIDGRGWEGSWSSLVPLQPKGTKPPLYCIHPIGGNVVGYVDLARRLGEDQPLFGLQAVGLDGKRPRHKRIEDMADHYVSEIRQFQPAGPYHLAGSSFGGTIAFEMAHRLRAQGCDVAFLGMFDTWGPDYRRKPGMGKWRVAFERTRERIILHGGNLLAAEGIGGKARYVRAKLGRIAHDVAKRMRRAKRPAASKSAPAPSSPAAIPKNLVEAERSVLRAKTAYEPRPYPGKITLFVASRQPPWFYPDPLLGWARFAAGEIETHEVPGYHGALTHEPRVAVLAEKLRECLARARADGPAASPAAAVAGRAT